MLYKPSFNQILLKKIISLYLLAKKPSKDTLADIKVFLTTISNEFKLNKEELEKIWDSFPIELQKFLWNSIKYLVGKFGK